MELIKFKNIKSSAFFFNQYENGLTINVFLALKFEDREGFILKGWMKYELIHG